MSPPNLPMRAAQVVMEVVDRGHSLERALAAAEADAPNMTNTVSAATPANSANSANPPNTGRARLREIAYGGCRHYHYFDAVLARLLSRPLKRAERAVHFLLINACHQIEFMRTPNHAAVSESVAAVDGTRFAWAGGLINAVLRNFLRGRVQLKNDLPAAARCALPDWLYREIRASWPEHCDAIYRAGNRKPPLTLRVNRRKISRADYIARLARVGIAAAATANSELGVTIAKPLAVARIPGFADGLASVQDESAQLTLAALGANALGAGARVLDACAAPGGKTGLLLEAQPLAKIVAVDLPARVDALRENLIRLRFGNGGDGGAGIKIIAGDLTDADAWWDGQAFDCIIVDAPCSATGVIRRHPDIKHRRRPEDIAKFAEQQLKLVRAAWPLLAGGGQLLYVTCSILPAENDEVIERFTARQSDASAQKLDAPGGIATAFGVQRLPGVQAGDGFYFCRLKKSAQSN